MLRYNDILLINFCKSLQNLGEESTSGMLMGNVFRGNCLRKCTKTTKFSWKFREKQQMLTFP